MFVHMQCMLSTIHRRKYDLGNIGRNGGASEGVTVLNSAFDDSTAERYIYIYIYVCVHTYLLSYINWQEPVRNRHRRKKVQKSSSYTTAV